MTILKNLKENQSSLASRQGRITLAAILIVSVVMLSGAYFFTNQTKGAAIISLKAVLSNPAPASTTTDQTITFTLPAGNTWAAGETLTVTYATGFVLTGLANTDPLDYDIKTDTGGLNTDEAIVAAGACSTTDSIEITSIVGQVITFTACSSYTAPATGAIYEIQIGLNATLGGTGNTRITNPTKTAGVGTADTKTIDLAGTIGANDTGTALVAIIEGVAVSVTVDESMSFSIVGVTNADCDTSFTTLGGPDTVTTDAAVPFGVSATETFFHACHDLTLSTNAPSGYGITGEENQSLLRTGSDSADKTIDDTVGDGGTATETTAAAWGTATNNGFGYSCILSGGGQGDCAITAGTNYKQFACTGSAANCDISGGGETIQTVASSAVPVNNKVSRIEYKLSIDGIQPAGVYSNTITYIATPTF